MISVTLAAVSGDRLLRRVGWFARSPPRAASKIPRLEVATKLVAFLSSSDKLCDNSNCGTRIEGTYPQDWQLERLDQRVSRRLQMARSRLVVLIVEPLGHVLDGVSVLIQKFLEHAFARHLLN